MQEKLQQEESQPEEIIEQVEPKPEAEIPENTLGSHQTSETEKEEIENEDRARIELEKMILRCSDSSKFKKSILPENPEQVDGKVLDRALETLLDTDGIELSKLQRLELFKQTIEYYSTPTETEVPLWHSTSSFSLRNGLEEGFQGGFGKITGEAALKIPEGQEVQKGLSVAHPEYYTAEVFQQIFARVSARKEDLAKDLSIDSERITGETLPEVFVRELFASMSRDEVRLMLIKNYRVNPEDITDEYIERKKREFIDIFNKRENTEEQRRKERKFLSTVVDPILKKDLEIEIEHHFPCFITFEGKGKEHHLTTVSRGEKPTHIPQEDMFWDKLMGEDIREIRVPQNQITKVQGWLEAKGLKDARIVPIEVYEIKRIIQNSIK